MDSEQFAPMQTDTSPLDAGLGNMGIAMARNLQDFLKKQGASGSFNSSLRVWNRTQSKAQPLLEQGSTLVASMAGILHSSALCGCHEETRNEDVLKWTASVL
jgi:hypothetical protein